jgi:hypothetical protein
MSTLSSTASGAAPAAAVNRRAVLMIVTATIALAAVIGVAGIPGGRAGSGPLTWARGAQVFTHPTIPGDRVLTGTLENASTHTLRVDIGDVRLRTAGGEVVPSAPVFLQASGKSLWSGGRGPQQVADTELLRTGRIALLSPGEEVPVTIAWHVEDGRPVRLDYKEGSLPVGG